MVERRLARRRRQRRAGARGKSFRGGLGILLFTHKGISGPMRPSISRDIADYLEAGTHPASFLGTPPEKGGRGIAGPNLPPAPP